MTARVNRLVAIVAIAAIAWFAGASHAHETRPGYLELREIDPASHALLWKRPTGGEVEIRIAPVVPDGCRLQTPDQQQLTPGAVVVRGTNAGASTQTSRDIIRSAEEDLFK